jgi:adenylate cyclase
VSYSVATGLGCLLLLVNFVLILRCNLLLGLCGSLISSASLLAFSAYTLLYQDRLLSVLPSLFSNVLFIVGSSMLAYWQSRLRYRNAVDLFKHLVDPEVVKQLLAREDPESLLLSKSCQLTILFSDIRGFTTLSESRTPSEIVNMLNQYFEKQVASLFHHQATLDKFIGDAVMAFWGAPLACDNQASLAIAAALEMIENLKSFKQDYGYKDFDIGIGIHTGSAVVGMVGTRQRYDYTAIGDSVNLASRIEGLTKDRARLLVSESTMEAAQADYEFLPCGEFQVKGRAEPVKLYEVRGRLL